MKQTIRKQETVAEIGEYLVIRKADDDPCARDFPYAITYRTSYEFVAHCTTENKACLTAYAFQCMANCDNGKVLFGKDHKTQLGLA